MAAIVGEIAYFIYYQQAGAAVKLQSAVQAYGALLCSQVVQHFACGGKAHGMTL
jgi:hypothetical protein